MKFSAKPIKKGIIKRSARLKALLLIETKPFQTLLNQDFRQAVEPPKWYVKVSFSIVLIKTEPMVFIYNLQCPGAVFCPGLRRT